ncbi:protein serine/threonine phosphatase 2C [Pilatotrama ljubarskyi]|nr:protein serine/threonine phosphatase 2C [Pilatotrama ljubarskyi]
MHDAFHRLDAARERLLQRLYTSGAKNCDSVGEAVQFAAFRPFEGTRSNDQMLAQLWDIFDQRWVFLAVMDGHGGDVTARFVVDKVPERIKGALEKLIKERFGGLLDRTNVKEADPLISSMLRKEIVELDNLIGQAVTKICPDPTKLNAEEARQLYGLNRKALLRAIQGTTLSIALIAVDDWDSFMWAAGVGDSTIALSTVEPSTGNRHAERLCKRHTCKDPGEFCRVAVAHPSSEKGIIDAENKLLGWRSLTRAIGDFPFKMDAAYTRHLFEHVCTGSRRNPLSKFEHRIETPPYIIAEPDVRFVDLKPFRGQDPVILLYTEGVETVVDGALVFTPKTHSGADPLDVLSSLLTSVLSDKVDHRVEDILGHNIEPRWSGSFNNMAMDILGNLLGGISPGRLEMVLDERRLKAKDNGFWIPDTSLIVARLALLA